MDTLIEKIRRAQVLAAEEAVIASIPPSLMEMMNKAQDSFRERGGCKGCGSQVLAVHRGGCPTLREPG